MATTYTLIASNTVGSGGASSVAFSSIPSTYTDLLVKVSSRSTEASAWDWFSISLNGSTSNFSWKSLWADTSPASGGGSGVTIPYGGTAANATANTFSNTEIYIPNYVSSNYKSVSADAVGENNSATAGRSLTALLWSNTAAITSLSVNSGTTFVQYSTFYLYGISNS
jgi:hypothetical protein